MSRFSFSSISSTDSRFGGEAVFFADEPGDELCDLLVDALEVLEVLDVLELLVVFEYEDELDEAVPSFRDALFLYDEDDVFVSFLKISRDVPTTSGAASSRKSTNSSPSASSSSHKVRG
jgi:hypothetical protein